MNKLCDNVAVVLSGNNIDFAHETKYLGVKTTSSMILLMFFVKHVDFMHKPICYCAISVIAPMMKNVCYSRYFVLICTVALFGLTPLHLALNVKN